jgi:hypothetical protein
VVDVVEAVAAAVVQAQARVVPLEVEERPEERLRPHPLAERRNWRAAQLQQRDNAEARVEQAAPVAGVAVEEEAVDVVGPVRLRYPRTQAT